MAQNKNALIRYRTIDKCLQNRYRKWTLNDLIDACSDALYEYEGRTINVSKRTVQLDIQMMRSDKLGYNAPIIVYDKKYYKYENEHFTITDIPLNETDMNVLSEAVEMLKQFKDFSLFAELGGIIHRLEDKIHTEKTDQPPIIHLDKNEHLKGLNYLDVIYQSILKKIILKITYQSFSARAASTFNFQAFILKEFNNRWFVVGARHEDNRIMNLALDRIINIEYDLSVPYNDQGFEADNYYKHTYGVTVLTRKQLYDIHLKVDSKTAPYVLTKPFHHSQQLLETYEDRSILIQIRVHGNFEIERLILGYGASIEVIQPRIMRNRIKRIFKEAIKLYE